MTFRWQLRAISGEMSPIDSLQRVKATWDGQWAPQAQHITAICGGCDDGPYQINAAFVTSPRNRFSAFEVLEFECHNC